MANLAALFLKRIIEPGPYAIPVRHCRTGRLVGYYNKKLAITSKMTSLKILKNPFPPSYTSKEPGESTELVPFDHELDLIEVKVLLNSQGNPVMLVEHSGDMNGIPNFILL